MTKEQAIERLKRKILLGKSEKNIGIPVYISELETVLSMLEEKDKQIDLMSEQLTTPIHDKKWIKKYYENKVNGGNER